MSSCIVKTKVTVTPTRSSATRSTSHSRSRKDKQPAASRSNGRRKDEERLRREPETSSSSSSESETEEELSPRPTYSRSSSRSRREDSERLRLSREPEEASSSRPTYSSRSSSRSRREYSERRSREPDEASSSRPTYSRSSSRSRREYSERRSREPDKASSSRPTYSRSSSRSRREDSERLSREPEEASSSRRTKSRSPSKSKTLIRPVQIFPTPPTTPTPRIRTRQDNEPECFLKLKVHRVSGMGTVPFTQAGLLTVTATFNGHSKKSAQTNRDGRHIVNDCTFVWPIGEREARRIANGSYVKINIILKVEKDELLKSGIWTHEVGRTTIPGCTDEVGTVGTDCRSYATLEATKLEHGQQKILYTVEVKAGGKIYNIEAPENHSEWPNCSHDCLKPTRK